MKQLIVGLATFGFASAGFAGALAGKVTASTAKPLPAGSEMSKADPSCPKVKAPNETVAVNAGKLANAFVYIKEGAKPAPATGGAPVLDQLGCVYAPHAVGVVVGQGLKIHNSDKTMHNVNAKSTKGQGFNSGMVGGAAAIERKFTKAEFIRFKCDVHGWMNSVVGVFENPYFAVTDKEGNFTIKDVPAGEYTVAVWHEKLGEKTSKVTVTDKGTVDFAL